MKVKTINQFEGMRDLDLIGREIRPGNFLTKLVWRFLKIVIEYYHLPPKHINCRCEFVRAEDDLR